MNYEERQARRAAITVGDVVYSWEYGYNHQLAKLIVTRVTAKQIVCGKVRFWRMTADRVGRTTQVYYTSGGGGYYLPDELWKESAGITYAQHYVQEQAENEEREVRHALYIRVTRFSYKHVPIELLQQIADLIQPYEEAEAKRKKGVNS